MLVLDLTMFPPSFTSSCGSKSPLEGAWSPSNAISFGGYWSSYFIKVLSLTTSQGPPLFLDPNSFLDHVVAPYPNGLSFSTSPTIIISPNPNASSFANPHVQNFQNHVNMFDSLSNMELDPLCKKQNFFEGKTPKSFIIIFGSCKLNGQQKCHG